MGDIIDVAAVMGLALSSIALAIEGQVYNNKVVVFLGRISAIIFTLLFFILFFRMVLVKLQYFGWIDQSVCIFCISKKFPYFRLF